MIGVLSLMRRRREEQRTEGSDEIVENGKLKTNMGCQEIYTNKNKMCVEQPSFKY
jgi:hypothetical protein